MTQRKTGTTNHATNSSTILQENNLSKKGTT